MNALATLPRSDAPTLDVLESEPSAKQLAPRCNIPIDLENWKSLSEEIQLDLQWFHQHILDRGLTNQDAAKALGYDYSAVFRVLKGTYEGNWQNVVERIRSYRRVVRER